MQNGTKRLITGLPIIMKIPIIISPIPMQVIPIGGASSASCMPPITIANPEAMRVIITAMIDTSIANSAVNTAIMTGSHIGNVSTRIMSLSQKFAFELLLLLIG